MHEGGWSVERGADGEWVFAAPNGDVLPAQAPRAVTGDTLAWLCDWAVERGLDLGADANLPLWDGTRPDYDMAVAGLLSEV